MNLDRLQALSNEIKIINAIINNEKGVNFLNIVDDDMSLEKKFEALCTIAYKALKSVEIQNDDALLDMFKELFEDVKIGEFCIAFIKEHVRENNDPVEKKLERLLNLDCKPVPKSQIKIDYLNLVLTLLLQQPVLDMESINEYNQQIKDILEDK